MRTTLTLDNDLAIALKRAAYLTERSFKAMVNETLRAGLGVIDGAVKPRPYRIEPAALGDLPGVDLNKALQLADSLEDEAILRKLEQRK